MTTLLSAKDLAISTPDGKVLASNLDFSLRAGRCLFVKGQNGSGKTTLLRTILDLTPKARGEINLQIDSDDFAFLPQVGNLRFFLPLSLKDVVLLDSEIQSRPPDLHGLLEPEHLEGSFNSASGGERQRALILRALHSNPRVLVADEPMNHLDRASRARVWSTFETFIARGGALLLVSHQAPPEHWTSVDVLDLGGVES